MYSCWAGVKAGIFFCELLLFCKSPVLCESGVVLSHHGVLLLVLGAEYVALGLLRTVWFCGVLGGRGVDGGDGVNKSIMMGDTALGGVRGGWEGCMSMLGVCLFRVGDKLPC